VGSDPICIRPMPGFPQPTRAYVHRSLTAWATLMARSDFAGPVGGGGDEEMSINVEVRVATSQTHLVQYVGSVVSGGTVVCRYRKGTSGVSRRARCAWQSSMPNKASFISTGLIPTGIDKYNKEIMTATIRYPDLFRVEN
jgi:hypothetical protein